MKRLLTAACFCIALPMIAQTVTSPTPIPCSAGSCLATGINDDGTIVGGYTPTGAASGTYQAFVIRAGTFITPNVMSLLPPLGGGATSVTAVQLSSLNDSEAMVGDADGNNLRAGFLCSSWNASGENFCSVVQMPGAFRFWPNDISNNGAIVGYASTAAGAVGFLLDTDGVFRSIAYPDAAGTGAYGINDSGQIVGGYSDFLDNSHGFLYDPYTLPGRSARGEIHDGRYVTLDPPGSTFTSAESINDSGIVVGFYSDSGGHDHGFVYKAEKFTTFDYPGATNTEIFHISNNGRIVGGAFLSGVFTSYTAQVQ